MLEIEVWPQLREPVLVVALTGWVDAGMAGATAASTLVGQLRGARRFGRIDLADLVDLQQTRPTVSIVDGETRALAWPEIACVGGHAGRDVVVCTGPEPSLRWPSVIRALVDMALRLGVVAAYGLGAMPTVSTHRRPVAVLATATSGELAPQIATLGLDYTGVTGMQTALLVALAQAGVPGVGLWAQVPHYVAGSPSPPAARALLARLAELSGVETHLAELDRAAAGYAATVEAGLAERPDVAELVQAIEAEHPRIPSGDELASEIERFLRSQRDPE